MALVGLLNLPRTDREWSKWSFSNADGHTRIIEAILTQRSVQLDTYILDPIAQFDRDNWLRRHQTVHNDMNEILGIAGNDLSDVDFKNVKELQAWVNLHAQEHIQANALLGV